MCGVALGIFGDSERDFAFGPQNRHPSATSSTIITLKPTAKSIVPTFECCPCDISGISSSTTTYSMAPAKRSRALRYYKLGELLFSQNSLAGFIFYGALAVTLVLLFSGHKAPAVGVMVVMFGIPLLAIFLKEPLERMVEKKGNAFPETGKGMFFVQAFFELFDVLLSYFSNTISFVRVGAYAVSHVSS